MKKMTLLVAAICEDDFPKEKIEDFLDSGTEYRGALSYALLGGSGEINTTIALIKQLREVTGAGLIPAKDAAYTIVETICNLGTPHEMRSELITKIDKMSPHQVRMLHDHVVRNDHYDTTRDTLL